MQQEIGYTKVQTEWMFEKIKFQNLLSRWWKSNVEFCELVYIWFSLLILKVKKSLWQMQFKVWIRCLKL